MEPRVRSRMGSMGTGLSEGPGATGRGTGSSRLPFSGFLLQPLTLHPQRKRSFRTLQLLCSELWFGDPVCITQASLKVMTASDSWMWLTWWLCVVQEGTGRPRKGRLGQTAMNRLSGSSVPRGDSPGLLRRAVGLGLRGSCPWLLWPPKFCF